MTHTRGIAAILAVAAMAAAVFVPADCDMPDVLPTPRKEYPGSWVICVEESAERPLLLSELVDDTGWQDDLRSRQLRFTFYDDDSPKGKDYAQETGVVPGLLIGLPRDDGKELETLHAGPWPDSREELDATIREVTGL